MLPVSVSASTSIRRLTVPVVISISGRRTVRAVWTCSGCITVSLFTTVRDLMCRILDLIGRTVSDRIHPGL